MSRPAIFLDRDGVLVEEVYYPQTGEWEAPLFPEDVKLTEGAAGALQAFRKAGYATVLVSNQGGFAKGKTTLRSLWLAHERFVALLAAQDAALDAVFYSFSHPEGVVEHFSGESLDRKPSPYNVLIAAAKLDLDLSRSWMIGDRLTDLVCARAAGLRVILIRNPHSPITAQSEILVETVTDAVTHIFGETAGAHIAPCADKALSRRE